MSRARTLAVSLLPILGMGLLGAACSLADIRPDSARDRAFTKQEIQRGRQLLQEAARNAGGVPAYKDKGTLIVELVDHWPSWILRSVAGPWPRDPVDLRQTIRVAQDSSVLEILDGAEVEDIWSIDQGVTRRGPPGAPAQVVDDADMRFWLLTLEYFIEMPFRIGEADVVAHLGARELDGQTYDLVFASWRQAEPQEDIDQYVIWIGRDSGQIDWVEYTVRDLGGFITGAIHYQDRREIDGLQIPHLMTVVGAPGDTSITHELQVKSARFQPDPRQ